MLYNLKNIISKTQSSSILSVIRFGNGYKYLFIATSISLIVTFFDIRTISLVPGLINSITIQNTNSGAFIFILFALVSGVARIFLSYISSKINTKVSSNISKKVFESSYKINIYELENFGISELSQVFSNDLQTITNELVYPILQIITSLILTFSILIFLVIKIPLITLIFSLLYITLYFIFIKTSKNRIRLNSKRTAEIRSKFIQSANELVISARYLKNSVKGNRVLSFLKRNDLSIKNMTAENNFLSIYPKFIAETFGLISISIIGLISAYYGNKEILSLLAILALSIQKIIPSFQSIFVAISSLNCNSANIDRIDKLIKLSLKKFDNENYSSIINRVGKLSKIKTNKRRNRSISLFKLNFSSSIDKNKKIDLSIYKNEWTGIVGKSGVGKTTLMDIITGISMPLKVRNVFKNKYENLIIEVNPKCQFIYLSQFNYIPNCPLLEYISNSDNKKFITKNTKFILTLLKKSGLYKELNLRDPYNLKMNLSENANSISGGQAQRLNILRTVFEIKNTSKNKIKILALDEPFKGLDQESKEQCIALLREFSSTSILITHSMEEAEILCNSIYRII